MNQFAKDVLDGLSATPKRLSSKYFYDEIGDKLFQRIMSLDDYYLTRSEYEILSNSKSQLLKIFGAQKTPFNLIEFGAGDGYKTKVLLKHFLAQNADFKYIPIDISGNVLDILETALKKELPDLKVKGIQNEYFKALDQLDKSNERNVVLFLGSNIGNFTGDQATTFLQGLYDSLKQGDILLIGFDLKKDPNVILKAYNDREGVTRDFNLNLLNRINNELGGNFNIDKFKHHPIYNPLTGTTTSFLVSTEEQTVEIMDKTFYFDAWEAVHMEISQKYDLKAIVNLAKEAGFKVLNNFYDEKKYFVDAVWQK
ncbi:MAG TPA: L-histidine N(alpha)-methyltransferase [Fulvivirga sp.]|nr:L-histidine N(alpha)-methyltransferase [Fulvivirga sp.]